MKGFLVLVLTLICIGCKKDNATEKITEYSWVLKTQVITPAITINGKTSTNYLSLQNPEGCSKNFTYVFYEGGVFEYGSNGALCDMVTNSKLQKWKREGNQITLDYGNGGTSFSLEINDNTLVNTSQIISNGEKYTLTSTYTAKK